MQSLLGKFLLNAGDPDTSDTNVIGIVEGLKKEFGKVGIDGLLSMIIRVVIVCLISFVAIQIYRWIWRRKWKKNPPKIQDRFIYSIILVVLYIVAAIIAFSFLPKGQELVTAIIQGSGFLAVGIGLASQDAISNIVGGMMISAAKPFQVGDRIQLINGKITGYIEDITLRHTVIRTFVNSRIIVPNSLMNKDMIENSNYQQGRASSFIDVTITFDSDIDTAKEIMAEVVGEHPKFLDTRTDFNEPKVKIFLRDLSINGINLRTSMWTDSIDTNFEACSDVRYELYRQFKEKGILFAQVPGRPEAFARAGTQGQD